MAEQASPISDAGVSEGWAFRRRFQDLVSTWRSESLCLSSVTDMTNRPAYQEIIQMGPRAISLLLGELARDPDHWFVALSAITGEDPVPPESRGDLDRIAAAWLRWGQAKGYRW